MKYAGFWIRTLAHLIDFVIWNGVEFGLESAITKTFALPATGEQIVGVVLTLLIAYLYYVELPMKFGTTPGKKLFHIYVVRLNQDQPVSRKVLLLRLIGYVFSYLALGCGFLMVLFHPRKLGLHDLFSGTASIRKPPGQGGGGARKDQLSFSSQSSLEKMRSSFSFFQRSARYPSGVSKHSCSRVQRSWCSRFTAACRPSVRAISR